MNLKELLEKAITKQCPPEELRGDCFRYTKCSDCRKRAFESILELLERDYIEKERDSLEKIEHDARLGAGAYWKCVGDSCGECPALMFGKSPRDFYKVETCVKAQILDLLRRQHEILEGEQCQD